MGLLQGSTYWTKDNKKGAALIRARQPYLVKNIVTGIALTTIVISIYAYTIKVISQDDFSDVQIPDAHEQPPHTPHTGTARAPDKLSSFYQAMASPTKATNKRPPAFNDIAPLEGAVVVEAPVASGELSPVGVLSPEVALELPVLRVMDDEPVLVDMFVLVDAPVVVMDEESVLLILLSVLVMAVALLEAAELGADETDLTVFLDSTTNWAE
ncbi:MAG: hypothetical protein Q9186_005072 [Xanthomendoza sp. 1 TL-2023]